MADKISRRGALGAGAAGAAALGLAACGGGDADVAEAPPEESEDLTGSIVMWIYPLADSATEEWYQPYVESFNEKYPNVDVQVVQQGFTNREEQLTTAISGGNAPDVVYFNPDFVPRFAEEELLVGLDDLRDDWDSFVPSALEAMTYEDTLYSAPILIQASPTFVNQKIMDEIGMEGPTTWDEMRAVGEAAKEAGYYLTQYSGIATLNHNYYMYLWQAGGAVLNDDMSAAAFNSPEGLEALEFIKEMVDNGWVPTEPLSVTQQFEQTELAQGNVAYSLGTSLSTVRTVIQDDLVILPPMQHRQQVAIGGFGALSIFNTTEFPEASAALIHHLTEPEFIEATAGDFLFYSPRTDVTDVHEDDAQVAEFEQYLDVVHPEVIHPQSREIMDSLKPEIQAVLLQDKDPQEALEVMEASINDLLSRS